MQIECLRSSACALIDMVKLSLLVSSDRAIPVLAASMLIAETGSQFLLLALVLRWLQHPVQAKSCLARAGLRLPCAGGDWPASPWLDDEKNLVRSCLFVYLRRLWSLGSLPSMLGAQLGRKAFSFSPRSF